MSKATAKTATLAELLDAVVDGRVELTDNMPSFGGDEPRCTAGVWSWDEAHLLVGRCADELELVSREQHEAECLTERAQALCEDR